MQKSKLSKYHLNIMKDLLHKEYIYLKIAHHILEKSQQGNISNGRERENKSIGYKSLRKTVLAVERNSWHSGVQLAGLDSNRNINTPPLPGSSMVNHCHTRTRQSPHTCPFTSYLHRISLLVISFGGGEKVTCVSQL